MMMNKVWLHVHDSQPRDWYERFLQPRALPAGLVIVGGTLGTGRAVAETARQTWPGIKVIARDWIGPFGDNFSTVLSRLGHLSAKQQVEEWLRWAEPKLRAMPYAYWGAWNEPWMSASGSPEQARALTEYLKRYTDFECERIRLLYERFGIRAVSIQASVGSPDVWPPEDSERAAQEHRVDVWRVIMPVVYALKQYGGIIGAHEYHAYWPGVWVNGACHMEGDRLIVDDPLLEHKHYDYGWLFLRYRMVIKYRLPAGLQDVPWVFTEVGADAGCAIDSLKTALGRPTSDAGGWRNCAEQWRSVDRRPAPEVYLDQIKAINRIWCEDPQVWGGALFTYGTCDPAKWHSFDLYPEVSGPLADWLATLPRFETPVMADQTNEEEAIPLGDTDTSGKVPVRVDRRDVPMVLMFLRILPVIRRFKSVRALWIALRLAAMRALRQSQAQR